MLASDQLSNAPESLSFSLASEIVELLILTTDDALFRALREAVSGSRRLWHVPSADNVSNLIVAGAVGIVVLDARVLDDATGLFIVQIKHQFPDLVVVVAGKREHESALAGHITLGTVYRFIHQPLSPERAKLFVDAAVKKYHEQRRLVAPPRRTAAGLAKPALLGVTAIVLVLALIAAAWALRHETTLQRANSQPATHGSGE